MLNLLELAQFVSFAECGTLSKAAEQLHISQPTLTRTMRHMEDAFGVPLFHRGKNHLALNQTGEIAVKQARKLLENAENAVQTVQAFNRSLYTIRVESCAPAPLWSLFPALSGRFPENTIASKLVQMKQIVQDVADGTCDIGILPFASPRDTLMDVPYIWENLSVCIPKSHPLEGLSSATMAQLNGFNCLVRDQIGFWSALCQDKMPASRFLVQKDEFAFRELICTSTLLCFTTDLANLTNFTLDGRTIVPITDPEANVRYHLICRPAQKTLLAAIAD